MITKIVKVKFSLFKLLGSILLKIFHVERFSPFLILLFPSHWEQLIPLSSPVKKKNQRLASLSNAAESSLTSHPRKEVCVNVSATEGGVSLEPKGTNKPSRPSAAQGWRRHTQPCHPGTTVNQGQTLAPCAQMSTDQRNNTFQLENFKTRGPKELNGFAARWLSLFSPSIFNFLSSNPNRQKK